MRFKIVMAVWPLLAALMVRKKPEFKPLSNLQHDLPVAQISCRVPEGKILENCATPSAEGPRGTQPEGPSTS